MSDLSRVLERADAIIAGAPFQPKANGHEAKVGRVKLDQRLDRKGEECGPLKSLTNIVRVLTEDPQWHDVLAYNERSRRHEFIKAPPFSDERKELPRAVRDVDQHKARMWMEQKYGLYVGDKPVAECFDMVCMAQSYEPAREWMESLRWDGLPRLNTWLSDYLGVQERECEREACKIHPRRLGECLDCDREVYGESVAAAWLISGVARTYKPGCKADHMLVLEGDQGLKKSSALGLLAMRDEWFLDEMPDLHSDNAKRMLQGPLIVEFAELDAMYQKEAVAVKAFLTRLRDSFVDKWQRLPTDLPRRCIFAGSTNDASYLKDHTGNRRFWPVWCTKVDLSGLKKAREQIWAEAVYRYESGEHWWLDAAVEAVAQAEQQHRQEHDPWMLIVERHAEGADRVFVDEVFKDLDIDPAKQDRRGSLRIGKCLRQLGFRKGSPRDPSTGKNRAGFFKPRDSDGA